VLVDGIFRNLTFAPSDNLVVLANAFALQHDMRVTQACPPEALEAFEALGVGNCASAQLVSAMNALLPPPPCSCQIRIVEPKSDQIWLLPGGRITVALAASGCGAEVGGTRPFVGAITLRATFAQEDDFIRFARDMQASDLGYLELHLHKTSAPFGPLHLALTGQPAAPHPCAGQTLQANVTVDLRPFTVSDPRDVLSVSDLERRVQPSSSESSPLRRLRSDSPTRGMSFAYASLLYSDDYLPGLLVLAASLREVAAKYPLLTLVPVTDRAAFDSPHGAGNIAAGLAVSEATAVAMAQNGIEIVPVEWLNLNAGSALPALGAGIWLKLHMWKMTAYDRIVYLDADTFVLQNLDELFALRSDAPSAFPSGAMRSER